MRNFRLGQGPRENPEFESPVEAKILMIAGIVALPWIAVAMVFAQFVFIAVLRKSHRS